MFSPGSRPRAFGAVLPPVVVSLWATGPRDQVIAQAELLPTLLARRVWSRWLREQHVIFFLDNESARHALCRGFSPHLGSACILSACALLDARCGIRQWTARVPTACNPADDPSRGRLRECMRRWRAESDSVIGQHGWRSWEELAAEVRPT